MNSSILSNRIKIGNAIHLIWKNFILSDTVMLDKSYTITLKNDVKEDLEYIKFHVNENFNSPDHAPIYDFTFSIYKCPFDEANIMPVTRCDFDELYLYYKRDYRHAVKIDYNLLKKVKTKLTLAEMYTFAKKQNGFSDVTNLKKSLKIRNSNFSSGIQY